MIDATILNSSALNVIVALAGALIGMTAVIVGIRARFVGHRALVLEHDLRESLGKLERRPREQAAIDDAISRQALAVQRVRGYAVRRRFFYRLLSGYLALMALALLFVWLLFENNGGVSNVSLRWFAIGAALAGLISGVLYVLVMNSETDLRSVAFSVEPLRIPSDRDVTTPSEMDLELRMRSWLEAQGWSVQRAPTQSGFDLLGSRPGEWIVAEIKAVPRLALEDVDAVAGAVARLRQGEKVDGPIRVVIAVPMEAMDLSPSVLKAAEDLGVEIYGVNNGGEICPAGGAAFSRL
jgi:hypothetical protein